MTTPREPETPSDAAQAADPGQYAVTGPPGDLDADTPHQARVYDWLLGGKDNFASDRLVGAQLVTRCPEIRDGAFANRRFLQRAVRHLASEQGIDQFLDIGCGLPTQGNVHEVVQEVNPDARVVYVDRDSVVIVHARGLLAHANPTVHVVPGDLNEPEEILRASEGRFDFDRPVAVLLVAVLHFFSDDARAIELIDRVMAPLAPGSFAVLSHLGKGAGAEKILDIYREQVSDVCARSRQELAALVPGLEPFGPGVVSMHTWRGEGEVIDDPAEMGICGVFRKP